MVWTGDQEQADSGCVVGTERVKKVKEEMPQMDNNVKEAHLLCTHSPLKCQERKESFQSFLKWVQQRFLKQTELLDSVKVFIYVHHETFSRQSMFLHQCLLPGYLSFSCCPSSFLTLPVAPEGCLVRTFLLPQRAWIPPLSASWPS